MEIAECNYLQDDKYEMRPLWVYEVYDEQRGEDGNVSITGGFVKKNKISDALQKRLLENGLPKQSLAKYL